jgi:phosphoribosylanthranilate isomerase
VPSPRPRFKICGITGLDDAQRAVEVGAFAVGLVLWPGSPRRCSLAAAERIASTLHRQAEIAGVFVNAPLEEVAGIIDGIGLTMAQLHGDEGPAYCAEIARRTGAKVIKARPIRTRADVASLSSFHTDFHLLDAYVPGRRGGTGETFDWELAAQHAGPVPVILSGGLTPANVGAAIEAVRPFAVDTASGTEARPGVKDPEKLRAFAAAVHEAADRDHSEVA